MGEKQRGGQGPANARGQVVMKHFTGPNGCGRIQTTMNPSSANPTRHHTSSAIACACATLELCLVGFDICNPSEMISRLRFQNTHPQDSLLARLSLVISNHNPSSLPLHLLGTLLRGAHALTTRRGQNWNGVMKVGHSHHESRNKTPQSGGGYN